MKVVLSYIIPALLIAALGFTTGIWWGKETKSSEVVVVRDRIGSDTSTVRTTQSTHTERPALEFSDITRQPSIFEQLHLTYKIASQSNLDRLIYYLAQSYNDPDPLFHHNITSILLERVIAIDPFEALAFIDEHPLMNQSVFISHVLTSWIRHDPEAAVYYFQSLTNRGLKMQIGTRLLADPSLRDNGYLSDIEAALGSQAQQIGERVRLNRLSPQDAFEDALESTDLQRQSRMMRAIGRWFQTDPDAAVRRLSELTNEREKQQLMRSVIAMQARTDSERALEMLDTYFPDDQSVQRQILPMIAARDPELALPRVEALISETGNVEILGHLLSQWIHTDNEAAFAYMATMPERYQEAVFQQISHRYIIRSPVEGMTWLMSLDEKYARTVKLQAISALSRFPGIAESWLDELSDRPEFHGALLRSMAQRRAEADPSDALEWLEQYADSSSYASSRRSVLQNWAHRDPRGLASLIEDDVANPEYRGLFQMPSQRWINADPSATLDWIASLPQSTAKANALSGAIPNMSDPEEAILLLDDLPVESVESATMNLANSWLRRQPDEVEQIITRLGLTEQQAATLRSRSQ